MAPATGYKHIGSQPRQGRKKLPVPFAVPLRGRILPVSMSGDSPLRPTSAGPPIPARPHRDLIDPPDGPAAARAAKNSGLTIPRETQTRKGVVRRISATVARMVSCSARLITPRPEVTMLNRAAPWAAAAPRRQVAVVADGDHQYTGVEGSLLQRIEAFLRNALRP